MAFLFHQNMRTYTAAAFLGAPAFGSREQAYVMAFGGLNAPMVAGAGGIGTTRGAVAVPPNPVYTDEIVVAGFTEVWGNQGAPNTNLGNALAYYANQRFAGPVPWPGPGTWRVALASPGVTALKAAAPGTNIELIGIAVHPNVTLHGYGRLYVEHAQGRNRPLRKWVPWTVGSKFECNTNVPGEASADYRGVVYVAFQYAGVEYAVGFIHNMYTFTAERVTMMALLEEMGTAMAAGGGVGVGVQPKAAVAVLGGDFNVPANKAPGTAATGKRKRAFWDGPYGQGAPTTGANELDYWYGHDTVGPVASIFVGTRNVAPVVLLSDHAGVLLRI